jgi:hypothetical protein
MSDTCPCLTWYDKDPCCGHVDLPSRTRVRILNCSKLGDYMCPPLIMSDTRVD